MMEGIKQKRIPKPPLTPELLGKNEIYYYKNVFTGKGENLRAQNGGKYQHIALREMLHSVEQAILM